MQTADAISDYERERGKPLPSLNHSITQKRLIVALVRYEPEYTVASELSLELEGLPSNVTPDLCVYPKLDIDYTHDEIRMTEPPLVAVEIASPTQATQEIVDKIQQMLAAGVQSCWLVQPAMQSITVYTEGAAPKTASEGMLEDPATGIEVVVDEVFAGA